MLVVVSMDTTHIINFYKEISSAPEIEIKDNVIIKEIDMFSNQPNEIKN